MKKEDLIKLAFVVHPHGIRGEAEVRLLNENAEESVLDDNMKVWLFPSSVKSKISPLGEQWLITKIRFGNKVICQLEGIKDRTHLETLLPFDVYLEREAFPELESDEVYLVDLIGMDVINEEGEKIGKLEGFDDNGMQYLFNVRLDPLGELMTLPYVDAFFPKIDIAKRQITMVQPEYEE